MVVVGGFVRIGFNELPPEPPVTADLDVDGLGGRRHAGQPDHPVETLRGQDFVGAKKYCRWSNFFY
jgi:hypothetical protein